MKKLIVIILTLALLFCVVGCSNNKISSQGRKASVDVAQSKDKQTKIQEEVDTSVTYADIYREFKSNELRAKDIYLGNRYQITAKINGLGTGSLLNLTGGATLTMEIQVDNTIVFFLAEFEKDQEEALKQVSVGDTITFIGTCYGGTFKDCKLQ